MKLHIQDSRGRQFEVLEVSDSASVAELKNLFVRISRKPIAIERVSFRVMDEKKRIVLDDDKALSTYGLGDGSIVVFKDLGPQIPWTSVFFWEYFGPLALYALIALYPVDFDVNKLDHFHKVALLCWVTHYAKRILETFFVHRFSHGTMPIFNLFKNCSYYWGFGALCAYFVNHPQYTPASSTQQLIGFSIFWIGECGNLICHLMLRALRPAGTRVRKIPRGFLFELVSCPNYTFEITAWIGFSIASQTAMVYLFTLAGAAQMYLWAVKKHRAYRKEFGDQYPRGRRVLVPFLL